MSTFIGSALDAVEEQIKKAQHETDRVMLYALRTLLQCEEERDKRREERLAWAVEQENAGRKWKKEELMMMGIS